MITMFGKINLQEEALHKKITERNPNEFLLQQINKTPERLNDILWNQKKVEIENRKLKNQEKPSLNENIKSLLYEFRNIKSIKVNGIDFDLNYRTYGKYDELENQLKKISDNTKEWVISWDKLEEVSVDIDMIKNQKELLIREVVKEVNLSQNRVEIADILENTFAEYLNFFIEKEVGYIDNDYRKWYYIKFFDRGNINVKVGIFIESFLDDSDLLKKNKITIELNKWWVNNGMTISYQDSIKKTIDNLNLGISYQINTI